MYLTSEFEFSGLPETEKESDVIIRKGDVPEKLNGNAQVYPLYSAAPGKFLFNLESVGRFLVEDGRTITVDLNPDTSESELKVFLFGSVLGALAHQRGIFALHASAVEIDGRALLFSGKSGAGKSTIAAEFVKRGYGLLCDDTSLLTIDDDGIISIIPGHSEIKLWNDSLKMLKTDYSNIEKIREEQEKFRIPISIHDIEKSRPVMGIYFIKPGPFEDIEISEIDSIKKIKFLRNSTYRKRFVQRTGQPDKHFIFLTQIANSKDIFIRKLNRIRMKSDPAMIVDAILKDLEANSGK